MTLSTLRELMSEAIRRGASDLHINPGRPPVGRVGGELASLTDTVLDDAATERR